MTISLSEKIQALYPELTNEDFLVTIRLQDDGAGPYIKEWNHPTLPRPTDAQLAGVDEDAYLAGIARKEAEAARASAYRNEADPLFFKAQRGEATIEEWQLKVAEIRSLYPYPNEEVES